MNHIFGEREAGGTNILMISSLPFEDLGHWTDVPLRPLPELTWMVQEKIPYVVGTGSLLPGGRYWIIHRRIRLEREGDRPAILTALIGYLLVVAGLVLDLGMPWHVMHVITSANFRSVMFEVAWRVMLYTVVPFLEFLPAVFERLRLQKARRWLDLVAVPLYIVGIVLSILRQSSLGSLHLIAPEKLHPLWYSAMLPLMLFLSAVVVGPAVVTVEGALSARFLRHPMPRVQTVRLGQYMLLLGLVYVAFRLQILTCVPRPGVEGGVGVLSLVARGARTDGIVSPLHGARRGCMIGLSTRR